jgi:hypothetical protein
MPSKRVELGSEGRDALLQRLGFHARVVAQLHCHVALARLVVAIMVLTMTPTVKLKRPAGAPKLRRRRAGRAYPNGVDSLWAARKQREKEAKI